MIKCCDNIMQYPPPSGSQSTPLSPPPPIWKRDPVLPTFFDQIFWPEFFWPKFCWNFFCPIFLFLKEEFKSGQVQIFFSQREFKNLDMSGFIFFKAKKNLDFASNNTFNDGWVQIWNFQLKIKNPDTSGFFIFKVKIKIWTRPDFYFLMQKFKSGLGDM